MNEFWKTKPPQFIFTIFMLMAFTSPAVKAGCDDKAPLRSRFEELFGQALVKSKTKFLCQKFETKEIYNCSCDSDEETCFADRGVEVRVKFDDSKRAQTISINAHDPSEGEKIAEQLLSEEKWGKFIGALKSISTLHPGGEKAPEKPAPNIKKTETTCHTIYEYEDDCFFLKYTGSGKCTDSAPVLIYITWKKPFN